MHETPQKKPAGVVIRDARRDDIPAIQRIYAHYVLTALATFEETPPDEAEMLQRFDTLRAAGYPYLVAVREEAVTTAAAAIPSANGIVGYSYATAYRARSAYRHSIENSIYVAPGFNGQGIGSALLAALVTRCSAGPWREMIAVIGDSANAGSIAVHRHLGFKHVGTLTGVGFKFGRWVDTVLMQRSLKDAD